MKVFFVSVKLVSLIASIIISVLIAFPAWAQTAPAQNATSDTAPAANTPASSSNGSAARQSKTATPDVSGYQVQVLKDGDKIPERKDESYENWESPILPKNMKPEIVPLMTNEGDAFTRELIHAQWRELDPIDLYVVRPKGVKNPPVIIYLYSYPTSNLRYKDDKFCQFVTRNGFAAVGFVPNVDDQRFHDRPTAEWFVSDLHEALSTTAHDVQMVINYLGTRKDVDMNRIGIWGDGAGGAIAILAAAVDPRIKVLDVLDPWGDWPDWLAKSTLIPEKERPTYLAPEFLDRLKDLDPIKWLPDLKTASVRMQLINEGVSVTPAVVTHKMEAAVPHSATVVHYDNRNAFLAEVTLHGKSFEWVQQQLTALGTTSESAHNNTVAITDSATKTER